MKPKYSSTEIAAMLGITKQAVNLRAGKGKPCMIDEKTYRPKWNDTHGRWEWSEGGKPKWNEARGRMEWTEGRAK